MFERWISLTQNLGLPGSEGGVIVRDDELPSTARVTIERKTRPESGLDYYCVTIGVYGALVHTAFFSSRDDAAEGADVAKLLVQALSNNR
jgi:hypothetical protein